MIVSVLLVSNSRVCCLAPRRDNTRRSLTRHTRSCLIPIITWCHHFFSTTTNIVLIKSNLKSESRATSLRCHVTTWSLGQVSQSPPSLVAKMRVPVFAGDWACEIELHQTSVICFLWRQRSWSCGVFKSWISYAHCPFPMKIASSAQLWYIRASEGHYVFQWDHLLDECLTFVQAGVPSCPDDITLRSCTNFKCAVGSENKLKRTDFRGVKCVFAECDQPYCGHISYYIRLFSTSSF